MKKVYASGFTLVELMITVVILGILVGISYPSYRNYMIQTRRSDAQIALTIATNQQERFFTECNYYAQIPAGTRACGASSSAGVLGLAGSTPVLSPDNHYEVTVVAPTASSGACPITSCYILAANPNGTGVTGRQANDGRFRINSRGEKTWDKANANSPDSTGKFPFKWTDK